MITSEAKDGAKFGDVKIQSTVLSKHVVASGHVSWSIGVIIIKSRWLRKAMSVKDRTDFKKLRSKGL